jgi:hypothetical protein
MKIVELSNGKFAIQISRFPRRFLDMKNTIYTWKRNSIYFQDCFCTKEEAFTFLKNRSEIIQEAKESAKIYIVAYHKYLK